MEWLIEAFPERQQDTIEHRIYQHICDQQSARVHMLSTLDAPRSPTSTLELFHVTP
jgi:hypothetical protein